jgi:hypothetical protein
MDDCRIALKADPSPESVTGSPLIKVVMAAAQCTKCSAKVVDDMSRFVPLFQRAVEANISAVNPTFCAAGLNR